MKLFTRLIGVTALWMASHFGVTAVLAEERATWVLIDIGAMTLSVMSGSEVQRTYRNIAIGRSGSTYEKRRRDGKTPLGEFRITRMSTDTPFQRFFALDFPNLEHAERARQTGLINQAEYAAIERAIQANKIPPQNTALGGHIGIHGIGRGDAAIHEDFNWTYGCIALKNAQIDDLAQWVRVGTRVIIRP